MARSNKYILQQDGYLVWVLFMLLLHIGKMGQKGEEPTRDPGQLEITYINSATRLPAEIPIKLEPPNKICLALAKLKPADHKSKI